MRIHKKNLYLWILATWVSFFLFSCATVDYRGVQSRFEQAVQLDNGRSVSAFTESSVFTEPGFEDVLTLLTPEYIKGLDERLQPNAWLLRAVSQWRTDRLADACESAKKGLDDPQLQKQSRDHILLLMIPGLALDMEIEKTWKQSGRQPILKQYEKIEQDYHTVFDEFNKAEQAMGRATPLSVKFFLYYQRWRVIQGWRSIINSISDENHEKDENAQQKALDKAKEYFNGKSLQEVANEQETNIPAGHPLRSLIEAQSKLTATAQ